MASSALTMKASMANARVVRSARPSVARPARVAMRVVRMDASGSKEPVGDVVAVKSIDDDESDSTASDAGEGLFELTQDTYYEYINGEESADVVVVDCFTDFCGPCKMIKPKLIELNNELADVDIVGFNCNSKNKTLGKKLGIKAVPHFFIYKNGELVDEMTGANYAKLNEKIEEARD